MLRSLFLAIAACLNLICSVPESHAQTRSDAIGIPARPSAPPVLSRKLPSEEFNCKRLVRYRGQVMNCDSNLRWDGENLRPILEDSPAAINELNTYQHNRRSLNKLAYVGGIGLASALASLLVLRNIEGDTIKPALKHWTLAGGGIVMGLTAGIGLTMLASNERYLKRAVEIHNQSHPNSPIEFVTGAGAKIEF